MIYHDRVELVTYNADGSNVRSISGYEPVLPCELVPLDSTVGTDVAPIATRYRLVMPFDIGELVRDHLGGGRFQDLRFRGNTLVLEAGVEAHRMMGRFHHSEAIVKDFGILASRTALGPTAWGVESVAQKLLTTVSALPAAQVGLSPGDTYPYISATRVGGSRVALGQTEEKVSDINVDVFAKTAAEAESRSASLLASLSAGGNWAVSVDPAGTFAARNYTVVSMVPLTVPAPLVWGEDRTVTRWRTVYRMTIL